MSDSNDEKENAGIADSLKKIFSVGISAAFMTEDAIRGYLSDIKLPKDVLNIILTGAAKSKDELMNRVSGEVVKILSKIDFVKEASRFVEEHKFRISAEVEVVKKKDNSPG